MVRYTKNSHSWPVAERKTSSANPGNKHETSQKLPQYFDQIMFQFQWYKNLSRTCNCRSISNCLVYTLYTFLFLAPCFATLNWVIAYLIWIWKVSTLLYKIAIFHQLNLRSMEFPLPLNFEVLVMKSGLCEVLYVSYCTESFICDGYQSRGQTNSQFQVWHFMSLMWRNFLFSHYNETSEWNKGQRKKNEAM